MTTEYVSFGDVARKYLSSQCQYACRYTGIDVTGNGVHNHVWDDYPDLGQGLRFQGNTNNYHSLMIHKNDVAEFVKRYQSI